MSQKTLNAFIPLAIARFGAGAIVSRTELKTFAEEAGISSVPFEKAAERVGRGQYRIPSSSDLPLPAQVPSVKVTPARVPRAAPEAVSVEMAAPVLAFRQPKLVDESEPAVPEKFPGYVPFGFFKDMRGILRSKEFYPVFVSGLSGNGKTMMIEQACADLNRECIRVNISPETDESDLIGGFQLIDGNTVYKDGPVLIAMKRGTVLLLDEVDRGSNKLMCLQGILEGKPYYNKKTGEVVYPKEGFNVVATANTKGKGSEEGRYLASILDDAFLERFPITVEQEYPPVATELKILSGCLTDMDFADKLVRWADVIRKTFQEGGIDEIISTRRLVHIAKAYTIFGSRTKAIELCVNRFDTETKTAFLDLYNKVDENANPAPDAAEDIPF